MRSRAPSREGLRSILIVASFACIYVVWGSTYLAIRVAVEHIPPFLLAGSRQLIAGVPLYLLARLSGAPRPERRHWLGAAVVGVLLLLGGNGGVTYAEQWVDSGPAALVIATVPLWVTLLDTLLFGARRPPARVWLGIGIGLVGVALLVGGFSGAAMGFGTAALLMSAVSWSLGTLSSRRLPLPASPFLSTAMQMVAGGAALMAVAGMRGEVSRFDLAAVPAKAHLAMAYLVILGSIVAFSAYVWLLQQVSPSRVSTYAYVNPAVALLLGYWLLGEPLHPRTLLAAAAIVAGVVLILSPRSRAAGRQGGTS